MGFTTCLRTFTLAAAVAALVLPRPEVTSATQARCGYHHVNPDHNEGAIALYTHCADSFILIRIDRSNSHSFHRCVPPWGEVRFFPSDGVTNAYYVPVTPDTMVVNGQRMCRLGQPPV